MSCSSLIYEKLDDDVAKDFSMDYWYKEFMSLDDIQAYSDLIYREQELKKKINNDIRKSNHSQGMILSSLRGMIYVQK